MRNVHFKILLLGLAFTGLASNLYACGEDEPTAIKFPGTVQGSVLRGDFLLCMNDAQHIIAVDLRRARTFDLGKGEDRRWFEADVADGQALLLAKNDLLAVSLRDGKTTHKVDVGTNAVWAYGFAGKGKAFVHCGTSVAILDLATGKTLHTIELGKEEPFRRGLTPWQKVGDRLYIAGPATTLCVIDLATGKLHDRFAIDSRGGMAAIQVEGSFVYCIGSPRGWGARIDHLTCFDMENKRNIVVELNQQVRRFGRLAGGPYGTVYVIDGNHIERYTMSGQSCGGFTTPGKESVLAVWHHRALIAAKGEIRLEEFKETRVTRK